MKTTPLAYCISSTAYDLNSPMKYTDPSGYNYFRKPNIRIDGEAWHGNPDIFLRNGTLENIQSIEVNGKSVWNAEKNCPIYYNERKREFGAYLDSPHHYTTGHLTHTQNLFANSQNEYADNIGNLETHTIELTWFGFSTYDVLKYGRFERSEPIPETEIERNNPKYPGVAIHYERGRRIGCYIPGYGILVPEKSYMKTRQEWLQHEYGHFLQYNTPQN